VVLWYSTFFMHAWDIITGKLAFSSICTDKKKILTCSILSNSISCLIEFHFLTEQTFWISLHDDTKELDFTFVSTCLIRDRTPKEKEKAKEDIRIKTPRKVRFGNLRRKRERFSELQARGRKRKGYDRGDRKRWIPNTTQLLISINPCTYICEGSKTLKNTKISSIFYC
jgi:hypothetical protein